MLLQLLILSYLGTSSGFNLPKAFTSTGTIRINTPSLRITIASQTVSRHIASLYMTNSPTAPLEDGPKPTPPLSKVKQALRALVFAIVSKSLMLSRRMGAVKANLLSRLVRKSSPSAKSPKGFLPSRGPRPSPLVNLIAALRQGITKPTFWIRAFAIIIGLTSLRTYLQYLSTLTLEVPYSAFLKLVEVAPERVGPLRVIGNTYRFTVDGQRALTRPVAMDSGLMAMLRQANIVFWTPGADVNYLGLLWTVAYMAFLYNMVTKMSQGPSDSGIGRTKGDLALAKDLSFDEVAGQDKAKLEVKEICDMLKAPERYVSL